MNKILEQTEQNYTPETTVSSRNLRPYQKKAIANMINFYRLCKKTKPQTNKNRCGLVVLPTGMGKTFTFCSFLHQMKEEAPNVLIIAHKRELCEQAIKSLKKFSFAPRNIDLIIRSKPKKRKINVGTYQSFCSTDAWRLDEIKKPDVIIIDECHRSTAESYQQIINHFPDAVVYGFTATPIHVIKELKKVFYDTYTLLYNEYTLKRAIEEGYLCNIKYYRIRAEGETRLKNEAIADKYLEMGGGKYIMFCNSVDHSRAMQHVFNKRGITCYHIDGYTHKKTRKRLMKEFAAFNHHDNVVLTNFNVFVEGLDIEDLRGVIIACKLTGNALRKFLQMIGRVTRLFKDKATGFVKEFGYVLEVRNNTAKNLIGAIDRIFRLYYQDVEEYEDFPEEPIDELFEEPEEDEEQQTFDDCITLDQAELELKSFFSPLPQSLIQSKLNWGSCVDGVYYCHVDKHKYFEIIDANSQFTVYGVNSNSRKILKSFFFLDECNEYCYNIAQKHYVDSVYIWLKRARNNWRTKPATENQAKILKRAGYGDGFDKETAARIIDMIEQQKRSEPASKKQQYMIKKLGYSGDMSLVNKSNVGSIIKALKG